MASFSHDTERRSSLGEKDLVLETEFATDFSTIDSQVVHKGENVFGRIQLFVGKFGVEQRGIERVLPEERTDTSLSKIGTLVSNHIDVP